jgi:hypothetical protein
MKIRNFCIISAFSASLFIPALAQAGNFEEAVNQASIEIDKANALNHEWRDSRKLLEKAEKLNTEGKTDQAMKLVAQAKFQGEQAVIQAKNQASVNGPRE